MKLIVPVILLLFTFHNASAQKELKPLLHPGAPGNDVTVRICAPSRGQLMHLPMYIIYSHKQLIFKSDTSGSPALLQTVNPMHIKSINILKDSTSRSKYGGLAKNGVIEIYLDDDKYPDAYKAFRTDSGKIAPKDK